MRRLLVQVPRGHSKRIIDVARRHQATDTVAFSGEADDGPVDLVLIHLPNRAVGELVGDLDGVEGLHVSMFPRSRRVS